MKKLILLLFIINCSSVTTSAQNREQANIDSLVALLPTAKEDVNKLNLYTALFYTYLYYKQEEGLQYEKPALELATKLKRKMSIVDIKYSVGRLYWRMGNFNMALKSHFEALYISAQEKQKESSANILTAIGQDYADGGNYPNALIYLQKALKIYTELGDKKSISTVYSVLGWVYDNQGNYTEASKCNYVMLQIAEELGDKYTMAVAFANAAEDYKNLGNYKEALNFFFKSIKLLEAVDDKTNLCNSYNSAGDIYKILGNYTAAIKCYSFALKIGKGIKDKMIIATTLSKTGSLYQAKADYTDALKNYLMAVDNYKSVSEHQELSSLYSEMGICYSKIKKFAEAKNCFDTALAMTRELKSNKSLSVYYRGKELLDSCTAGWENAYKNYKHYIVLRDSTFNKDNLTKMLSSQMQYESDKKEAAAKAEQEKKDIHQRNIRNSISAGLAGALIFLVVVYRQRNKISKARKRSDELLLNILPSEVAEELKQSGEAEAKQFDNVTVLFTDFVGFTLISEKLTPKELVAEIHTYFTAFDKIMEKHGLEKIKTIGDAYLAICGLPHPAKDHAKRTVLAAMDIIEFIKHHEKQGGKFNIRVGINSGSVVAGIVGVKKFAYDIWGDTVNTAARMEQNSKNGKINISESTYQLVKNDFKCEHRGKIAAKNKGEVDMYFVEHKF